MQYKNTFINHYLQIKVCTNSGRIYKLIENVLDFDSNLCHSKHRIKIEFYLDEVELKDPDVSNNFLYQSCPDENRSLLTFFGNRIANIKTDHKTGIVKGIILNYQESRKERIFDFIFTQPLHFILAYRGFFFLHASAVCKDTDCILIIGPQDSGKSTLAFILSQNGFNLLTDDDCFVKLVRNQTQLLPFPTKIGLNEGILKKYPELYRYTLKNYYYGGKPRLSLNSISNSSNTKGLKCKIIIFPKYKADRNISIKQLSRQESLYRLAKENLTIYNNDGFQKLSVKNFEALCNLTEQADSFELTYNDNNLNKIAEAIKKVVNFKD